MAAPTIVASTTFATNDAGISTTKPVTFAVPAGTLTGDHILAVCTSVDSVNIAPSDSAAWTLLGGWEESGTVMYQAFAAEYAPGLNMSFISTTNTTVTRILPCSITVRGAAPVASWVKGALGRRIDQSASVTTTAPAITTLVNETLAMGLFAERTTATETDIVSVTGATRNAFLSVFNDGAIETITVTQHVQETPGTTSPVVVTYPNTQASNGIGQQIGIPPAPIAGNPPVAAFSVIHHGLRVGLDASATTDVDDDIVTYTWDLGDGQATSGRQVSYLYAEPGTYTVTLTVQDSQANVHSSPQTVTVARITPKPFNLQTPAGPILASGFYISPAGNRVPVTEVRVLSPGYGSVANMLAQDVFRVAHRGGSEDFPEMSLHGYTQSALLGYGALEISLGRSIDGVWFGLHDETLDRTSGILSATASTMTWDEIQRYPILGSTSATDPSQPDRPYMRLEEILERYYGTHVLFIDPKYQLSRRTELLDILDAQPGTPQDRIVIKYFGVEGNVSGTIGLAVDAAARGYERWGYFYEGNSIADYQDRWSILGMSYSATQAAWDSILAYGKPVMGHICPTAEAAASALSKGAVGLMCSGVKDIAPGLITPRIHTAFDAATYDSSTYQ